MSVLWACVRSCVRVWGGSYMFPCQHKLADKALGSFSNEDMPLIPAHPYYEING